jgi:hypothetical protein
MAKWCPVLEHSVTYLSCMDCGDEKPCRDHGNPRTGKKKEKETGTCQNFPNRTR